MMQLDQFVYLSHAGEVDSSLHHLLTHLLLHRQFKNSTNSLVLLVAVYTSLLPKPVIIKYDST